MTQQNTIDCIKALSRIEGYTMSYEGMRRSHPLYDAIDLIMSHLQQELSNSKASVYSYAELMTGQKDPS